MRTTVALLGLILVSTPPGNAASAATGANSPVHFQNADSVLAWINAYRHAPEPARLPDALGALSRAGALNDPETAGVYVGFIAGVIAANPARARRLIAKMTEIQAEHHWVIVRAIAYSGAPEWKSLLRDLAPRVPNRQVMVDRYVSGGLPTLEQVDFAKSAGMWERMRGRWQRKPKKAVTLEPTPDVLDSFWGYYFATGAYMPVARIVGMLAWSNDRDDVEKLTVGSMAKYTLALNATRGADLLRLLKWARAQQSKDVRKILDEVIEAAENVETARLRKQALAAIDEFKRKGPGYRRELSMWSKVGQGALSLGCIGAAATGQVALGLPCVIGGAMSSAALNFWNNGQ
ncbi:MAG: hypothetical protein HY056_09015 [Proteobacteria bacterium]|nr:hypothetical protein [Pseudomonadota bacterium]